MLQQAWQDAATQPEASSPLPFSELYGNHCSRTSSSSRVSLKGADSKLTPPGELLHGDRALSSEQSGGLLLAEVQGGRRPGRKSWLLGAAVATRSGSVLESGCQLPT